jgi:hypothetical protein
VKATVRIDLDVSPDDLAKALTEDPEQFARFWFAFAEHVKNEAIDLEPFGKAMAPKYGGMRKHPFNAITDFMRYYERKEEN